MTTTKKAQAEGGSIEALLQREKRFNALLDEALGLFTDVHKASKEDRSSSQGRMGLEEAAALRGVVDAMELRPTLFQCLADEDEGHNPEKLETELLRERFDRHGVYARVVRRLNEATQPFADTALRVGEMVKPVTLAAYKIAKPVSTRDPALRSKLAGALDYYGNRKPPREDPPKDG